jgi:hypothetical protein
MHAMLDLGSFGDERLRRRGANFLEALISKRTACLRLLGGDRGTTVAYGRFLHNETVTRGAMVSNAAFHVGAAARGRHVLAIQDTTELNFAGHVGSKRGFDVVGNGRDIGLFVHPVIVVEAGDSDPRQVGHAGGILGLADAKIYGRKKAAPGGRKAREAARRIPRPIEEKETFRWIEGSRAAQEALSEAAMVTDISDREGDFFEHFAAPRAANAELITRATHDRKLSTGGKLFATMAELANVVGQDIVVSGKDGKPGRVARTRVSWQEIEMPRPRVGHDVERLPPTIKLNAIRIAEVDPPPGAKPVMWLLLTTHPVDDLEEALRVVGWYRARWTIEQVFRVMKSQGFDLESSQIETPDAMAKLALAVLIAALRTMQLVNARSGTTGQRLADAMGETEEALVEVLSAKLEGKTERQKNPHPEGSLARLSWVVARLGGWNGYEGRHHRPAGPITMGIGLVKFDAIREGWLMRARADV